MKALSPVAALVLCAGLSACGGSAGVPAPLPETQTAGCMDLVPGGFPVTVAALRESDKGNPVEGGGGMFSCIEGEQALSVDPETRTVLWTVTRVDPANFEGNPGTVYREVRQDPQLPSAAQVPADPYADNDIYGAIQYNSRQWVANSAPKIGHTFYTSNLAVADHGMLDAWKQLDDAILDAARRKGPLTVISGAVTGNRDGLKWINLPVPPPAKSISGIKTPDPEPQKMAVAPYFYRLILRPESGEMIAYIIPNKPFPATGIAKQAVSVERLEASTGLVFFPLLPPERAQVLKSKPANILGQ